MTDATFHTPADLFADLSTNYLGRSGVDAGKVWHNDGLRVNGKTFAMLVRGQLVVKVPARRAAGLVAAGTAEAFEPRAGRPLTEWVSLPLDASAGASWADALDEAYRYVATLTGSTQQPSPAIEDPTESALRIAAAFGLGRPSRDMRPNTKTSQETWRLDTSKGAYLVKRFWRGPDLPWQPSLEQAMAFETVAVDAGIDTVEPIAPVDPAFGFAASIDGLGVYRAYPYLEHRPLEPDDDVLEWAGRTLARIQDLQAPLIEPPEPTWFYNQFPAVPPDQWESWAARARDQQRTWAASLADLLPTLDALSGRVVNALASTPPHVTTHRDVEPWNVLMVPAGAGFRPVLVDWDVAGPDSAVLEAAHVVASFAGFAAGRDRAADLRRGAAAYHAAGGRGFDDGIDLLARTIGMRLAKLSGRLRSSVDAAPAEAARGVADTADADATITRYLDGLPAYVEAAEQDAIVLAGGD